MFASRVLIVSKYENIRMGSSKILISATRLRFSVPEFRKFASNYEVIFFSFIVPPYLKHVCHSDEGTWKFILLTLLHNGQG